MIRSRPAQAGRDRESIRYPSLLREIACEYIKELDYRRLGRGSCENKGISGTMGACVRFT